MSEEHADKIIAETSPEIMKAMESLVDHFINGHILPCNRYRLIIAGGRDFKDKQRLYQETDEFIDTFDKYKQTEIVSGMARGADSIAIEYAKDKKLDLHEMPADWDGLGNSAGYRRNEEMADYADALIAFWDGKSKGTKHMIDIACKKGLNVKIIYTNQ